MGPVVDAETGFQYLRARYYDPATGQFLTRDPIEAVTREAYGYAGNNPLNFTDPTGLGGNPGMCTTETDSPRCNAVRGGPPEHHGFINTGITACEFDAFGSSFSTWSNRATIGLAGLTLVQPELSVLAIPGMFVTTVAGVAGSAVELAGGIAAQDMSHVQHGFLGAGLGYTGLFFGEASAGIQAGVAVVRGVLQEWSNWTPF